MENQKQITENNNLLAKFLGIETIQRGKNGWEQCIFSFHHSYDSLFKVVDKIESLDNWIEISSGLQNTCLIGSINSSCESFKSAKDTKIEAVYTACVEFVKWYNEQK